MTDLESDTSSTHNIKMKDDVVDSLNIDQIENSDRESSFESSEIDNSDLESSFFGSEDVSIKKLDCTSDQNSSNYSS